MLHVVEFHFLVVALPEEDGALGSHSPIVGHRPRQPEGHLLDDVIGILAPDVGPVERVQPVDSIAQVDDPVLIA